MSKYIWCGFTIAFALCVYSREVGLVPACESDASSVVLQAVHNVHGDGGGTVRLADGEYHFYSSSATNMRFHVSNHDQPEIRPVFLPFIGVTNVSVVAKNAKFVMHGMGTAILIRDSLGVSFRGITIEWAKPFFAKAEIVGFEEGKTRVRFPARDRVVVEDGKLMLCGEDWKVNLRDGNVFDRTTHEMVERTADVIFSGKGSACESGEFLIDVDLSRIGAGAKVGDVYVMRNGYRPHPIVCLDRAKDTVFENFVFRDGFGMGILAQLSENVTLCGGGCYPRDRSEYNSNTIDATHFSNCRGTVTVENCRFEGMMDDALNVHSTCLGIVAKPAADTIRCRYMHHQAVGFGVFSAGDAVRFIAGRTLENGFVGKVKSVVTHDEREITLVMEKPIPPEYGVGDAVENADWQCAVVFRNNMIANNRARGVLFTTPHRIVCEGNFFDHVSGSAILFAGDAQGWYESGACEDVVIRKNRFRDCLTSVFQYCDGLVSIHPEVKDIAAQKRRYHRNIRIEDNDIETFDVPLLYALSAEDVVWRNNRVKRHSRYRGWNRPAFEVLESGRVDMGLGAEMNASGEGELTKKLPDILARSAEHYRALDAAATPLMKDEKGGVRFPHGFNRAKRVLEMRPVRWWTSGHFPGSLWYLYAATGDAFFKDRAIAWTEIVAENAKVTDNHDIGFIMNCSFGNARRFQKTDRYDALLVETADSLAKRFDDSLGLIRSWGEISDEKEFLVIPDNLMNLELLEIAAGISGEMRFDRIARSHATITMKNHFRSDGGTYHVLNYSQGDGRVQEIRRGQGASCFTAWSRGQSWAIYGYTMMYRFTKDPAYLAFAQKVADFAINHPNMPADGVPYWDYGAPGEERDSSAASIMASGLLELSTFAGGEKGAGYRAFAVKQILSLASSEYFSSGDEIGHFLLKHGVGFKPAGSEVDTPLDYGDYYFLEALVRFSGRN